LLQGDVGVEITWIKETRTLRLHAAEVDLDYRDVRSSAEDARVIQRAGAAA